MDLRLPRGSDPLERGDYIRNVLVWRQNAKLAPYTFGYQCVPYDRDRTANPERGQHIHVQALKFRGNLLVYRPVGDAELAGAAEDGQRVFPSVHDHAILPDQEVSGHAPDGRALVHVARYPILLTDRIRLAPGTPVGGLGGGRGPGGGGAPK